MKTYSWCVVLLTLATRLSLLGALTITPIPSNPLGVNPNRQDPLINTAGLVCQVDNVQGTLVTRWRHDNETYTLNSTGRIQVSQLQDGNGYVVGLAVRELVYTDNGSYICEARDNVTTSFVSATVNLTLFTHLNASDPVAVFDNVSSVELSCEMAGYVPPVSDLRWSRDGMMIQNDSKHSVLYQDGSRPARRPDIGTAPSVVAVLVITEPRVEDSGEYQCKVVSLGLSDSVQLMVDLSPTSAGMTMSTSPTPGGLGNLTLIIAIVAAVLGLIVIVLLIVITVVACQRFQHRSVDFHMVSTTSAKVTTLPHAPNEEYMEDAPPVPERTYSQSSRYSNKASEVEMRGTDMPDLIRSYNGTHQQSNMYEAETRLSESFPYYDNPEESHPPRIIPPSNSKADTEGEKRKKRTYYDEVELLTSADKGHLPGASGFSLSTVPSPHDVLSGSLQRQNVATVPDFNYPAYQDGFSPDDLAPYDAVEHDYDQIYSEPIEPAMLNAASTEGMDEDGLPFSAIYSDPKPLSNNESPLEITRENIIEIKKLGNGQFGQVILARTRGLSLVDMKLSETNDNRQHSILVAVKKLKTDAESGLYEAFNKEVKFMSRLNHDNVIRLLGVCYTTERFIMMEYMENGDLNQFLQKHTLVDDTVTGLGDNEITPIILLYIGVQIASGMHYLASHRFVHRDLATRNCLVGKDFIVKISDFGMSRRLYESAYYRVQGTLVLPIRWMACETFYGKFSLKSDAWAFGVALWEIYTLATCDPYEEMNDEEVIQDAIRGPNRKLLPRPEACSRDVYDVMLRCWVHSPSMRADFGEIYSRLYMIYTSQAL